MTRASVVIGIVAADLDTIEPAHPATTDAEALVRSICCNLDEETVKRVAQKVVKAVPPYRPFRGAGS